MGTTANTALRYPEPTDLVSQGALAMRNLAEDADARLVDRAEVSRYLPIVQTNLTSGVVTAIPVTTTGASGDAGFVEPNAAGGVTVTTGGIYHVAVAFRLTTVPNAAFRCFMDIFRAPNTPANGMRTSMSPVGTEDSALAWWIGPVAAGQRIHFEAFQSTGVVRALTGFCVVNRTRRGHVPW